jgi:hypothetical protein
MNGIKIHERRNGKIIGSDGNGATKRKIATLDFETDPFKHGRLPRPFAVGFYDGYTYQSKWGSAKAVTAWAVRRVKGFSGVVYAHNGGKFDFLAFLLGGANETIWGEPVLCIGGRIVKMRYGQAELRDSYAILPSPLRDYDKGMVDYADFERGRRHLYRRAILDYLARDVRSLHSLVMAFVEKHGLGPLTMASAAMRYAKKLGLKVETFNDKQDEKFRAYYFGGLVLSRQAGIHRGNFTLYDIKSAYPFAMLHEHPSGRDFSFTTDPDSVKGNSFVVVDGDGQCFLRRTTGGNSYGGAGRFHITGWEFLESQRTGQFQGRVIHVETPVNTINFRPFVEHFYAAKSDAERTGDKAGRLIAKLILNALYGKFAQRNDKFRDYFIWPLDRPVPAGFAIDSVWDREGFQVVSRPSPHRGLYNVATAASITGYIRAMLMKAVHETDPYYCDTDSIICQSGHVPSGMGGGLGAWSLETEGDRLYIGGKKLYALRLSGATSPQTEEQAKKAGAYWDGSRAWKIASKGCRLTPLQMKAICQGKAVHYKNDAPCYSLLNSPFFVNRTITATAPMTAR